MQAWAKIWASALLVVPMTSSLAHAQTESRYDPYGARGDDGVDLRCSPGSYVVGMTGAAGTNIDRIQIACAKLGPDGFALPSTETSAPKGGPGGAPQSQACDAGTYLNAINVWLTLTKTQVYFLMVSCTNRRDGGASGFNFGAQFKPVESFTPYSTRKFVCPANTGVTGLTLRFGRHVNALGVICDRIVLQPATVVTPPGPARTGPVVTYGKPKNGAPAPVVKYPSLVGTFALVSRSGNKLVIVLNEADGNDLFGTIASADPRYNGAVTATAITGRKFKFTYNNASTGQTGSGTMTYNGSAGDAIIGTITSDGPPPASEVWGGKRQ